MRTHHINNYNKILLILSVRTEISLCERTLNCTNNERNYYPVLSRWNLDCQGFLWLNALVFINPDISPTGLLISRLGPPDKHSWNHAIFLWDGFHPNHICLIWHSEIVKGQYFYSGIHFISPPWHIVDSVYLYFSEKKKSPSFLEFPANLQYVDRFFFLLFCFLELRWHLHTSYV